MYMFVLFALLLVLYLTALSSKLKPSFIKGGNKSLNVLFAVFRRLRKIVRNKHASYKESDRNFALFELEFSFT